jgi:3-isopropylmalate/(R)-2-methylmalate dehydratase small subunit
MTALPSAITGVHGRAVVLRGADIDTDRIMPARYLKAVTFEGLERHLFADDRAADARQRIAHPLDRPGAAGAALLLAQSNFGCGSSREHAPQALRRWGFRAVIAESFSPIFAGNALSIGLVCVSVTADVMARLMATCEATPATDIQVDLQSQTVSVAGGGEWPIAIPDAQRQAWLSGQWDATGLLLANYEEVERVDARLPYLRAISRNA